MDPYSSIIIHYYIRKIGNGLIDICIISSVVSFFKLEHVSHVKIFLFFITLILFVEFFYSYFV